MNIVHKTLIPLARDKQAESLGDEANVNEDSGKGTMYQYAGGHEL